MIEGFLYLSTEEAGSFWEPSVFQDLKKKGINIPMLDLDGSSDQEVFSAAVKMLEISGRMMVYLSGKKALSASLIRFLEGQCRSHREHLFLASPETPLQVFFIDKLQIARIEENRIHEEFLKVY